MPFLDSIAGWFGYIRAERTAIARAASARAFVYAINQAMYDNIIYLPRERGGHLEHVLRHYCGVEMGRIVGHFNPAKEIVETYQNVLRGTLNDELQAVQSDSQEALDEPLKEAITSVWRDSNMDTGKAQIIRLAANLGTVGLKVCTAGDKVMIQGIDPLWIFDMEQDASGNVTAVVLKYTKPINYGTPLEPRYEDAQIIEQLNKDDFSQTIDGKEQVPDDDRKNTFGFCPFVPLRHKDNGTMYGDWAYKGAEHQIHDINWHITNEGRSIDQHRFPNWFATAGGKKPEMIELGGERNMMYVESKPGTPPPNLAAIVPQIDHGSAMKYDAELRDMLRTKQPELNINDVQLFANISGDTIEQVLKPSESAILSVRPAYDHAFIRAIQMAISMRIDLGMESKLGSSGDGAYENNKLAFQFAKRPALPQTAGQLLQQAQADTARQSNRLDTAAKAAKIGVDNTEQLRIAGYTDKEVKNIQQRKATVDKTEPAIM